MTIYVLRDGTEITGTDHEIIQEQDDIRRAQVLEIYRLRDLLTDLLRAEDKYNRKVKIIELELKKKRP